MNTSTTKDERFIFCNNLVDAIRLEYYRYKHAETRLVYSLKYVGTQFMPFLKFRTLIVVFRKSYAHGRLELSRHLVRTLNCLVNITYN